MHISVGVDIQVLYIFSCTLTLLKKYDKNVVTRRLGHLSHQSQHSTITIRQLLSVARILIGDYFSLSLQGVHSPMKTLNLVWKTVVQL